MKLQQRLQQHQLQEYHQLQGLHQRNVSQDGVIGTTHHAHQLEIMKAWTIWKLKENYSVEDMKSLTLNASSTGTLPGELMDFIL